uniref:Uncharacterized protein n=1 Tax=Lepeophtheirus salmonis TaxID=72036 RepID=A0A0K2U2I5_LEPSM
MSTSKRIDQGQEQVVVTFSQVQTIGWMHKNFLSKLPEHLVFHRRCVRPWCCHDDVLLFPIHQSFRTGELFTVEARIE